MEVVRQRAIIDELRQMIVSGKALPGDHLQEVALSRRLGVSRTPIREALIALEREGLAVYRPNRGYVVREFTLKQILDANFVRETLESAACRLVAEAGIELTVERALASCISDGDRLLAGEDRGAKFVAAWRDMNARFHQEILGAARNEFLVESAARALAVPLASMRVVYWFESPGVSKERGAVRKEVPLDNWHLKRSQEDHCRILDAITARQGARAEGVMREHIHAGAVILKAKYERYFGSAQRVA